MPPATLPRLRTHLERELKLLGVVIVKELDCQALCSARHLLFRDLLLATALM